MLKFSLTVFLSFIAFVLLGCGNVNATTSEPVILPTSYAVRVMISEQYVNSQMLLGLENDATLQNPVLDVLPPNRARGSATVNLKILGVDFSLRPSAAMHFDALDGRAVFTLDSVELNGINVPTSAVQQDVDRIKKIAEDQINADVQNAVRGTKLKLTAITATDDSLVLDFNE